MPVPGASVKISQAMLALEGVTQQPHRFGGQEYRLGRRELGHVHGDHLVDIPFPRPVRDEVVAAGLAQPHHLQPDTGWISLFLRQPEDVASAISLLVRSYQLALAQRSRRADEA
jgi:hypothetical protein